MYYYTQQTGVDGPLSPPSTYDNCEPLSDELQVSWTVDQTEDRVFFQLCGCVDAGDYMAFGLSGSDSAVQMVGADAVVTWHDSEGTGAVDYYLSARAQVSGTMPCVINIYVRTYLIIHTHTMYICTYPTLATHTQCTYPNHKCTMSVCMCVCACVCVCVCVCVMVHYSGHK